MPAASTITMNISRVSLLAAGLGKVCTEAAHNEIGETIMRSLKIINIIRSRTGIRWQRVCGLLAITAAASLLSVKLLLAVYAAAGDLDPSFGNGGKVEGVPDFGRFAIQADGKLVTIGSSPGTSNFLLSRLRVDGSLDSTFGVGGQVETNFGVVAFSNGLAIQSDGRIVVVGSKTGCSSCEKIVLVRYKTNGSLDTTFSADGIVEIPTNVNIHASTLALQPDGKIVVVGWVIDQYISPQPRRSFIIRLNEDGTLDQSFAAGGYLITTVWDSQPNSNEGFEDIVIQDDGKFVVLSIANVNSRMVRFFANGVRDWSFGNGQFDSPMSERNEHLALQPDGKIVMAANNFSSSNHYGLLVRLSADGILDTSFGQGGRTAGELSTYFHDVSIQEDGRLIVGGTNLTPHLSLHLSRYQSNGWLDASFGSNGIVTTGFSQPETDVRGPVGLYSDGRIVMGGKTFTWGTNGYTPVMARYLSDDHTPLPADLRVSRESATPTTVYPGSFITYTISVTNSGPGKSGHLTFNTPTPSDTTFESFGAPPGWVIYTKPARFSSGLVSCSAYELPAGATVSFSLTVRVSSSVTPGTQINHACTVWSFMPDPNSTNNTLTKTITVQ